MGVVAGKHDGRVAEKLSEEALRRLAEGLEQRTQPVELLAAAWRERRGDPVLGELVDGLVEAAAAFRSYRRLMSLLLSEWWFAQLIADLDELNGKLDEARAWARSYEHRDFEGLDTDNRPEWLTEPLTLDEGAAQADAAAVDARPVTDESLRSLHRLAQDVLEFGEEGLAPGAMGRLATGVLSLRDELEDARSRARWGYRRMDEGTKIVVEETPLWLLDEGNR